MAPPRGRGIRARLEVPGPARVAVWDPALAQLRLARDPLGRMGELFERHGAPVALIHGGGGRVFSGDPACPGVVFVRGPALLREVELRHDRYHRSALTGKLSPRAPVPRRKRAILEWGTGLFAVNDERHRRHRRLMAPAFTHSRVEGYYDDMVRFTDQVIGRWRTGFPMDLHREMLDLTVRISAKTLLGLEIDAGRTIVRSGAKSLELVLSPWVLLAPWDLPGLPYRRFLEAVNTFNREMRAIIRERRAAGARGSDVLSRLIFASDEEGMLTDSEVVGHASVVYAASHETTGNALTWALFLLSQHPEWYERVLEELQGLAGPWPSPEELGRLPILERVILETLRITPAAPWTTRIAAQETELGGFPIPKGTEIVVSIFHTHRLPELYEEADRFDPGRWERIEPDVFEFNPFGGGSRACIGRWFAMMEMKLVLAAILRRFRPELVPGTRVDPILNITMSFRRGLPMRLQPAGRAGRRGVGEVRGAVRKIVQLP